MRADIDSRRFGVLLLALTLLAGGAAGLELGASSFNLDESLSWSIAAGELPHFWKELRAGKDSSGVVYASLLRLAIHLGGENEASQRLVGVLCFAVFVLLCGLLGRRLGDRRAGLVCTLLAALHPLSFSYARLTRAYALFCMLSVALLLSAELLARRDLLRRRIAFALSLGLFLLTQVVGLFLAAIFGLALFKKELRSRFLWPLLLGGAPFLVWALIGLSTADSLIDDFWATSSFEHALERMSELLFRWPLPGSIYVVPALMLFALVDLLRRQEQRRSGIACVLAIAAIAAGPILMTLAVPEERSHHFILARYFAAGIPLIVVLSGLALARLPRPVLGLLLLALLLMGVKEQQANIASGAPGGAGPREASQWLAEACAPEDLVFVHPWNETMTALYYGVDADLIPVFNFEEAERRMREAPADRRIWALFFNDLGQELPLPGQAARRVDRVSVWRLR